MVEVVRVVEVVKVVGLITVVELVRKLNVPTTTRRTRNPLHDHAASGW